MLLSFYFSDSELTFVSCLTGPAWSCSLRMWLGGWWGWLMDPCRSWPVLPSPSAHQPPFFVSRILQLLVFPWLFHHKAFYPHVWHLAFWGYLGGLPFCHLPLFLLRFHGTHFFYFFAISYTSIFYFWPFSSSLMNFPNKRRSWFIKKWNWNLHWNSGRKCIQGHIYIVEFCGRDHEVEKWLHRDI